MNIHTMRGNIDDALRDMRQALHDAQGERLQGLVWRELQEHVSHVKDLITHERLATDKLLKLAHQYASECGDCAGTRLTPDDQPCTECTDIWAVIDHVEREAGAPADACTRCAAKAAQSGKGEQ